jgi:hypothetical protein
VPGDRDGNPHEHGRGQDQHAIQNTHNGQHNKMSRREPGRCGPALRPGARATRIGGRPWII